MSPPISYVAQIADPQWAQRGIERLREAHDPFPEDIPPENQRLLSLLLGFSPYITNVLVRRRDLLELFIQRPFPRPCGRRYLQKQLEKNLATLSSWPEVARYLRQIKQREILKILAWDLAGTSFSRTTMALTALAEAFLESALHWLQNHLHEKTPFIVMGMGKLGARELNYSSDIDLIYFFHGPWAQKEPCIKLAQELTRLVDQLLDGERLFRVDLRLRPGGKEGELVYSLKAAVHYYISQAHPFERLALIKARCCAGNRALGKAFLRTLRPVVYPRYLDYAYLEHLFDLKERIAKEAARQAERDIKLGPGGIREVEFFTQALQMIYGGKFPGLRVRTTLWALSRLEKVGLVPPSEARALKEAYVFLRTLEHRLQTIHFRQTARIPEEPVARLRLARSLGFTGEEALEAFEHTLRQHRERVHEIFEGLFRPQKTPQKRDPIQEAAQALIQGEPVKEWAQTLGLSEAHLLDLQALLKAHTPLGQKKALILQEILPPLLKAAERYPQALGRFLSFWQRLGGRLSFFHALKHHPEALEDLFLIFARSNFLTNLLNEVPQAAEALFEPEALEKEIKQAVRRRSYETALGLLRLYRNETLFRVGLADLKGRLALPELLAELSDLAHFVVQQTWRVALLRLGEEHPETSSCPLAVLGLGKLGSRELGYRSDLDLLFVYQGGLEQVVPATRLAQRLLAYLTTPLAEGPGYEVDTRLRPEGRKGPLAVSLEALKHYYQHEADLWERLALTRLNPIAGDLSLGKEIKDLAVSILGSFTYGPKEAEQIHAMRLRMEKERTKPGFYHPKVGYGGLADLEFAVQWLTLKHIQEIPQLLGQGVLPAVEMLVEAHLLTPEKARCIRENYLFLRTVEQKLILLLDKSGAEKQYRPEELALLRTYLGPDVQERYEKITRQNRRLFEEILEFAGRD